MGVCVCVSVCKVKGTHVFLEVIIGSSVPEKFLPRVLIKKMIYDILDKNFHSLL